MWSCMMSPACTSWAVLHCEMLLLSKRVEYLPLYRHIIIYITAWYLALCMDQALKNNRFYTSYCVAAFFFYHTLPAWKPAFTSSTHAHYITFLRRLSFTRQAQVNRSTDTDAKKQWSCPLAHFTHFKHRIPVNQHLLKNNKACIRGVLVKFESYECANPRVPCEQSLVKEIRAC